MPLRKRTCHACGPTEKCIHRFPKDAELRAKWLSFCKSSSEILSKSARLCIDHFQETDIIRCASINPFPKPFAIPTIYTRNQLKRLKLSQKNDYDQIRFKSSIADKFKSVLSKNIVIENAPHAGKSPAISNALIDETIPVVSESYSCNQNNMDVEQLPSNSNLVLRNTPIQNANCAGNIPTISNKSILADKMITNAFEPCSSIQSNLYVELLPSNSNLVSKNTPIQNANCAGNIPTISKKSIEANETIPNVFEPCSSIQSDMDVELLLSNSNLVLRNTSIQNANRAKNPTISNKSILADETIPNEKSYRSSQRMNSIKSKNVVCSVCSENDSSLSFFKIPADDRRKRWLTLLQLPSNIPKTARICCKHFAENSFYNNPEKSDGRKRLKRNAVPTLLLQHPQLGNIPINKTAASEKKNPIFNCVLCGPKSTISHSAHRFPVDKERSQIWLKKLGIYEQNLKQKLSNLRLCSDHFDPNDFEEYPWRKVKRLKENVNPIESFPLEVQIHTDDSESDVEMINIEFEITDALQSEPSHSAAFDNENHSHLPDETNFTNYEASTSADVDSISPLASMREDHRYALEDMSSTEQPPATTPTNSQLLNEKHWSKILQEKENAIHQLKNENNHLLNKNNRLLHENVLLKKEIEELRKNNQRKALHL